MGFLGPALGAIGGLFGGGGGLGSILGKILPGAIGGAGSLLSGGGDEEEEGRLRQGWDKLMQTHGWAFPWTKETAATGAGTVGAGLDTLGKSEAYWSQLLSGHRPTQLAAIAPEVQSINEAAAARRAQQGAYGTARGGGTAGEAAEAESGRMTAINQALFGARRPAAEGLTQIGTTKAYIGLQQIANALRALGLSQSAIASVLAGVAENRRVSAEQYEKKWGGVMQGAGDILGSLLK